jgi:hydrogenase maturation protein HypF
VGFRPFAYRLAGALGLQGWVSNDPRGVTIEVEGSTERIETFKDRLATETPPPATATIARTQWLEPVGYEAFEIRPSSQRGARSVQLVPDIATCALCLGEVLDPRDRRHLYPFTNCTHCGPRFSIIRDLPYDRPRTTMSGFEMCDRCRAEYEDPADRRFHAQPNACPACGPVLALMSRGGDPLAEGHRALREAARALAGGGIVAVKGLGGFHLMTDARDGRAIARLRRRKRRLEKPFALLVGDLSMAEEICHLGKTAARLLASPECPIVLLPRRAGCSVDVSVAPGNPRLGIMLPCAPLHHLLMAALNFPVVATSGNLSEEPICIEEDEALLRLGGLADLFLVHNRPIRRHADDSVVSILNGKPRVLRRARGYAPRPVAVRRELPPILAVGGHLKNTAAIGFGKHVFITQHIGNMETPEALAAFERAVEDFLRLYAVSPACIAHDLHPDYATTRWARDAAEGRGPLSRLLGVPRVPVQHHHAHLAACLADNGFRDRALGVTWDGTGYGTDGTIWGGEFLTGSAAGFVRTASLHPYRLPGGEAAIRETCRSALALLRGAIGDEALDREDLIPVRTLSEKKREILKRLLERRVNSPVTTSAGRLFDGAASLIGLRQRATFEGQAAMELEHAADQAERGAYPMELRRNDTTAGNGDPARRSSPALILDWRPMVRAIVSDLGRKVPVPAIAARFHNGLVDGILAVARAAGEPVVALTGGCFQNRLLVERSARRLRSAGFRVLLHRQVPPNDGGLSLGQVVAAARRLETGVT